MRALSLWQPHGSLIITGAKPFETRHWSTKVRGDILLHAAARCQKGEMEFYLNDEHYQDGLVALLPAGHNRAWPKIRITDLAYGAFIGIGELVNCIRVEDMTKAQRIESRDFGDFSEGRFAWEFRNVRRFKTPIPAKGRQGFFFAGFTMEDNELIQVT